MELSAGIWLLLAIVSSASMSIVLKLFQGRSGNRYTILLGNYLTCILLSLLFLPEKSILLQTSPVTLICGVIGGFFFVAGLICMQSSIAVNGAILTSAFARLGLLVPLFISLVCFGERPGLIQVIGIVIVFGAMWLISSEDSTPGAALHFHMGMLVLVLLCCGSGDAMAKVFEHVGERSQDGLYIFYVFATAAVLTVLLLMRESRSTGKKAELPDLLAGIAVGIPNYFSSSLLLRSLVHLPAFIVYPSFSAGAIVLVTLFGVLVFHERPGKRQWAGLILILGAVVMLNI